LALVYEEEKTCEALERIAMLRRELADKN